MVGVRSHRYFRAPFIAALGNLWNPARLKTTYWATAQRRRPYLKPMSGAVHGEVGTVPFAQALDRGGDVDGERLACDGT